MDVKLRNNFVLEIAKLEALQSTLNFKHGAVIWNNRTKEIVAKGHNRIVPTTRLKRNNLKRFTLHAEASAILKAVKRVGDNDLSGVSLLVIRQSKTKLSNSKPCKSCMSLIKETKIKNVYYSTKDDKIEKLG